MNSDLIVAYVVAVTVRRIVMERWHNWKQTWSAQNGLSPMPYSLPGTIIETDSRVKTKLMVELGGKLQDFECRITADI